MLDQLKNNGILCLSADGTRGHKFIPASLLGQTVSFPTGAVSLAKISGASMLPLFCFADAEGTTRLDILPPVQIRCDGEREQGLEKSVLEFTSLLESYLKNYPEQYRNWHYFSGPPDTGSSQTRCL